MSPQNMTWDDGNIVVEDHGMITQIAKDATDFMVSMKAQLIAHPVNHWHYFSAYAFAQICADNGYTLALV